MKRSVWLGGAVITIVLCLAIFALPFLITSGQKASPRVAGGTLDLSAWDFARDGSVTLEGEWQFFDRTWGGEIDRTQTPATGTIPGAWPAVDADGSVRRNGHGTYQMVLKLPEAPPGDALALDTGYVYSTYRLYANGALIASNGTPSATAAGEVAHAYSQLALLPQGARTVELRLEISNHLTKHGGVFIPPHVGLESAIASHRALLEALSILLIGAMLFSAAYHLVAYTVIREVPSTLCFALFAVVLGARTMLIEPLATHVVPFISQDWVWRVDFAATILLPAAAYWFFALTFPAQFAPRLAPWYGALSGIGAMISILFGPVPGGLAMLAAEISCPFVIIYMTQAIARAAWQREPGAVLALVGWLLSAAATFHDLLLDAGAIHGINMIPFGFLTFFLCLSGTLVARYSDAFRRTEQFSRSMKTRNDDLEAAVGARTRELSGKIQELKKSQVELERARSEAVSANVAKSRFLAMMSHELRTPLNSILGFSDIIRAESLGPVGDKRYGEYATHIHDSGTHLLNLIGDVLDISRIEAGKVDLRLETLDIAEIAENAARHAATRERRASDSVTMSFEPRLPLVKADQRAVTQMVINLLSNALKFTPPGGHIGLSVRLRGDGGVTVEVADKGVGMETADIPKALALFSQVDDGHARKHEGTGLGLPIVKSLIELHGGRFSLESEKGQGTLARLEFPPEASVGRGTVAA